MRAFSAGVFLTFRGLGSLLIRSYNGDHCFQGFVGLETLVDFSQWELVGDELLHWVFDHCLHGLEGSEDVLQLMAYNPFPEKPPRYVRSVVYDYRFSDYDSWRFNHSYWEEELKGGYSPIMSLNATPHQNKP